MKKCIFLALAALLLTGCASLLERSYDVVEPYTDRYWDPGAEDTLRVENHQDLVNSLLLLIDQRTEEATIRCYGDANAYMTARSACLEVRQETIAGSYLLDDLSFDFTQTDDAEYRTLTCRMSYREDAEDPENIMTLSDSQSLVDLLRVSVREEMGKLTTQFVRDTPQEEVTAAVESLWQELCRGEDAAKETDIDIAPAEENEVLPEDEEPPADTDMPSEEGEAVPADGEIFPEDIEPVEPDEPDYPPCPWEIRFYPDQAETRIVEILLTPSLMY